MFSRKICSNSLARPITGISLKPTPRITSSAEDSCPLPPSITIRSGNGSAASRYRRNVTSCIDAKSSGLPSTVLSLKRRYSALSGSPPVNTTIEATVSAPWMWEISKHSIRFGRRASDNRCASSSIAAVLLPCFTASRSLRCLRYSTALSAANCTRSRLLPRCGVNRCTAPLLRSLSQAANNSDSGSGSGVNISRAINAASL